MARKSIPSFSKSHNGISADEFQRKLLSWFQDRGLLSDLQSHLRRQMIVALRDTSLSIHSTGSFHQAGSPKLQAINLLVAEFLLQQDCHYTLSVFTSEVPLLRNLPEFTTASSSSQSKIVASSELFPGFQERDVQDILEALGFSSNSEECLKIYELYQNSQGEALLTCLIRCLPQKYHSGSKNAISSDLDDDKLKVIIEQHSALAESPLFTKDIQALILRSSLEPENIVLLHDSLERIIIEEVVKVREEEEVKLNQELVAREERIQSQWQNKEDGLRQKLEEAEQSFNRECDKLRKELKQKQVQLQDKASHLREQQNDIANRLHFLQEKSTFLDQKEQDFKVAKRESEEYLDAKSRELEIKEKQIEEEIARLESDSKAREDEQKELERSRIQVQEVSKALLDSHKELDLLHKLQQEHLSQMKLQQETEKCQEERDGSKRKKKVHLRSQGVQTIDSEMIVPDTSKDAVPKKQNTYQQTIIDYEERSLQTQISGTDIEDTYLQLRQQSTEQERQRAQQEMYDHLVERLQQEITELRGHNEEQRQRIQELTVHASQLAHRLDEANSSLDSVRRWSPPRVASPSPPPPPPPPPAPPPPAPPPIPVQRRPSPLHPPQAPPMQPALAAMHPMAFGYQPIPDEPPAHPHPNPSARHFTSRSRQLGAGEDSYFSRRLPPETARASAAHSSREQRRKLPRRLMVHSVTSSDESSHSPTEEMLREARRRLRRLEEETSVLDQSYQEFRLRHTQHLTGCASILFQTVPNLPSPAVPRQTFASRPQGPGLHSYGLCSPHSRHRNINAQATLLSQLQRRQPAPIYSVSRTTEQASHSLIYTSSFTQSYQRFEPVYSVPSSFGGAGGTSHTFTVHTAPLSSAHISENAIGRSGREESQPLPAASGRPEYYPLQSASRRPETHPWSTASGRQETHPLPRVSGRQENHSLSSVSGRRARGHLVNEINERSVFLQHSRTPRPDPPPRTLSTPLMPSQGLMLPHDEENDELQPLFENERAGLFLNGRVHQNTPESSEHSLLSANEEGRESERGSSSSISAHSGRIQSMSQSKIIEALNGNAVAVHVPRALSSEDASRRSLKKSARSNKSDQKNILKSPAHSGREAKVLTVSQKHSESSRKSNTSEISLLRSSSSSSTGASVESLDENDLNVNQINDADEQPGLVIVPTDAGNDQLPIDVSTDVKDPANIAEQSFDNAFEEADDPNVVSVSSINGHKELKVEQNEEKTKQTEEEGGDKEKTKQMEEGRDKKKTKQTDEEGGGKEKIKQTEEDGGGKVNDAKDTEVNLVKDAPKETDGGLVWRKEGGRQVAGGEDTSGRQSPSLPSSLGSSNELSSNIISAGDDKSDENDSW